jgi:capsular exopolysaccharide synthesis family protein
MPVAPQPFGGLAYGPDGYPVGSGAPGGINLWYILRVLRKWWWLIALCIIGFTAATAYFVSQMTPIYRSAVLLEVKQQETRIIEGGAIEDIDANKDFFTTQVELLRSEKLIEDVVENLNLLSDPYFYNAEDPTWTTKPREEKFRSVVDVFKGNLGVSPVGRSRLIQVSFQHADPDKAALIANSVSDSFINNSVSRKFNATAYARDFLETRLAAVKASLENAERNLVQYAQANNIINIDRDEGQDSSGSLDMASLVTLDSELTMARTARVQAEQRYQQSLNNNFAADVLSSPAIKELNSQRIRLESEYKDKQSTFKPNFPDMIELKSRIELFDQEIAQETAAIVESRRAQIKAEYDLAKIQEQDLQSRVAGLKGSVNNVRSKSIDYNILKRQVETERAQYDALLQRLKEVSLTDDIGDGLVQVVDPAKAARLPFKPNKIRSIIMALLLSSALGFSAAFLLDVLDDRVKSPDDIKSKLNQTIMGVIPRVEKGADIQENLKNSQTAISEAYASLRTNIQYSGPNGGPRVLQITSTRPSEGKSVSSLGLALRFAGVEDRILLIDADMRRPTFASNDSAALGLSGVLTADVPFEDHILQTHFNNMHLMTSGISVPNPSELLSSTRFDELLEFAKDNYDYVVIDSPPVLGLADAPVIGNKVDATLLVVEANQLRTPAVRLTIERLMSSGTKILGVLLTKYNAPTAGYMDYYSYSYGKGSADYGAPKRSKASAKKQEQRKLDITS